MLKSKKKITKNIALIKKLTYYKQLFNHKFENLEKF